jgi:uncharacterized protein YdeI (YjbR/CyaY-like superfamily)
MKPREEKLPHDIQTALKALPKVKNLWDDLTPLARRDFVAWITNAKQSETRARRISVMTSKLASGKKRPCCYAIVPMNLYKALNASPKAKAAWKTLSPDERRDLVGWIDEVNEPVKHLQRIDTVCAKLAKKSR